MIKFKTLRQQRHRKDCNFIYSGMVQVASKPLVKIILRTTIVMSLSNNRDLDCRDSIIRYFQTRSHHGQVRFQYYPNFRIRLKDVDNLDSFVFHV